MASDDSKQYQHGVDMAGDSGKGRRGRQKAALPSLPDLPALPFLPGFSEVLRSIDITTSMNEIAHQGNQFSTRSFGIQRPNVNLQPQYGNTVLNAPQQSANPPTARCCFGTILEKVSTYTSLAPGEAVIVSLTPLNEAYLKLVQGPGKHVGLLQSPAICSLVGGGKVECRAILLENETMLSTDLDKQANTRPKRDRQVLRGRALAKQKVFIRIAVYGRWEDKDIVGDALANGGIYLQHPSRGECDGVDIEYCNPHYLVPPGDHMPAPRMMAFDIALASGSIDAASFLLTARLGEVAMARLSRIFDSANGTDGSDGGETILNVVPSRRLATELMSHQNVALAMMWEKECGVVARPRFPPLWIPAVDNGVASAYRHAVTGAYTARPLVPMGGILADDMGLGKTLSVLSLICTSLDNPGNAILRGTLIVAPKSTIYGWETQIMRHIHPGQVTAAIYHGQTRQQVAAQLEQLDIVLTTYGTLRVDCENEGPLRAKQWLRVVLDEAHHIRNRYSKGFQAVSQIQSQHRWCLTGTPIQNSLEDFGALLSYIRVMPYIEKSEFEARITNPVLRSNDSRAVDMLQRLVKATCLRRTKALLCQNGQLNLSKCILKVEQIELHPEDKLLYDFFRERTTQIAAKMNVSTTGKKTPIAGGAGNSQNILALMNFLRRICDHGESLLPAAAVAAWQSRSSRTISLKMMQQLNKDDTEHPVDDEDDDENKPAPCVENPGSTMLRPSAKVEALVKNIMLEQQYRDGQPKPAKSVVFSCWTAMLDLVEKAMDRVGLKYQRLDGQTTLEARRQALSEFATNDGYTVMLASLGSCGEGVDLTVASNVHILEPQWNPMAELQAVDRVNRKGQTRQVTVTRYLVPRSVETYIRLVQRNKVNLVNMSMAGRDISEIANETSRWNALQQCLAGQ